MSKMGALFLEQQEARAEAGFDEFLEEEHKAGFHNTFTEHCYECHREDRLLKAKATIGRNDNYPPGFNLSLLD